MGSNLANGIWDACRFDMCALEGDSTAQSQIRCAAYEQLNTLCINFANANNLNFNSNWRTALNCRNSLNLQII